MSGGQINGERIVAPTGAHKTLKRVLDCNKPCVVPAAVVREGGHPQKHLQRFDAPFVIFGGAADPSTQNSRRATTPLGDRFHV